MSKAKPPLDDVARIRAKLGHCTMEDIPVLWLQTEYASLNRVLGNQELGIPYGRIVEISGWESHGKTGVVLSLMALAQRDGAGAILLDFENSTDLSWCEKRGLDPKRLHLLKPYVGRFGKERLPRLCTAQELCAEAEALLVGSKTDRNILVVDSVPSMLPEGSAAAGLEGRNMRTRMDLSMFMSELLQRWVGVAQVTRTLMIFINQLRTKPGVAYGNPDYTPGGNALKFYSHVRVRLRRAKGGRIKRKNVTIGIQGIITCMKNKCGGLEGSKVGYHLLFDGPISFLEAEDLETEE